MTQHYHVIWHLPPNQDFYHASKVLSGLCDLARHGAVSLRFTSRPRVNNYLDVCVFLEVLETTTGQKRRVVLDLHDRGNYFLREGLAFAELYLKRSFDADDLTALAPEDRAKVIPFGLNFACLSRSARWTLVRQATRAAAGNLFRRTGQSLGRKLRSYYEDLKHLRGLPETLHFEQPADAPCDGTILFQSRVWPPEKSDEDLDFLNHERARLVRALRQTFKDRYVGGIMADAYAREHFPDVLAVANTHRREYIRMSKRNLIGIYTRGLHHSMAFKLAEYLGAALCMVSEPFRHVLPAPLEAGTNFLPFVTVDECVAQCERLLSDSRLAQAMREANQRYYETWVRPEAHVRYWLNRVFEITEPKA